MPVDRGTGRQDLGQAILEFALAIPVLLAFILFIVDCGLLAFSHVSLSNAVREGARCAAVGGTANAVAERVIATYGGPGNGPYDIYREFSPLSPQIGDSVTVSADYDYEWITPVGLVPGLSGTSTLTKAATMRMETADTEAKASC